MANHNTTEPSTPSHSSKTLEGPKTSIPKMVVSGSPSIPAAKRTTADIETRELEEDVSLNDDLISISGSGRQKVLSRASIDSVSYRRSFESSMGGKHNVFFGFDNETHSGSQDYSPLGNNSIFEIVMNTRRKNWLGYPTSYDIPPVILSKNEIDPSWKEKLKVYISTIDSDSQTFQSINNLKNMNRTEQLRHLQTLGDDQVIDTNEELYAESKEIEKVPSFFFEKDFHLDNPRTFQRIIDDANVSLVSLTIETDKTKREESFVDLKEKLGVYLDSVENLLVAEISKSSHKFFHALADVDQIKDKLANCIAGLSNLENELINENSSQVVKKINHLQKLLEKRNVEQLEQGLFQVKEVLKKTEECKQIYQNENYDECLELIDSIDSLVKGDNVNNAATKEWTKNWPHPLVDLKAVPALLETREYLTNMKIEIGGKYSLQLCNALVNDLVEHCQSVSTAQILARLRGDVTEKTYLDVDQSLEKTVNELVRKLNRCSELASCYNLYQVRIMTELKSAIKKYLPQESAVPDKNDDNAANRPSTPSSHGGSSKLSKLIREQTPLEFQNMLVNICTHISEAARRLYRHQKLLLDMSLDEITTRNDEYENEHNMITQLDIRNGINEALKVVQLRMGKIIAVRRELLSTLRCDYFLSFYWICVLFTQECEAVSGEFLTKYLSDILAAQIRNYIAIQTNRDIWTLKTKFESEAWVPFIVDPSVQRGVNNILSSLDMDPLEWKQIPNLISEETQEAKDDITTTSTTTGHRKSVVVGDKTFVASETLLTAIDMIKDTLILSVNLPAVYLPSFEKLCYEVLTAFNLNAVTTLHSKPKQHKNLSIMGESLDCLAEFVRIIESFFQRQATTAKDYSPYERSKYTLLLQQYQTTSEKIYLANAPPPPV